jgi:hypothetical protein
MNSQLEEDWRCVLAKTGRAKAPAAGSAARRGGSGGGSSPTPAAMRASLMQAVARKPQVMLKITRYSKNAAGVAAHLAYISRTGKYANQAEAPATVYDQDGAERREPEAIQEAGENLASGIPGLAAEGAAPKHGRKRERCAMHMMLSMPPGTDKARFELGVRDFLKARFGAHEYLYAFHDDTDHYHSHVLIGMQGLDGRWLNPGRADLQEWREDFAAALERHGIEAQATRAYSRGRRPAGYRRDLAEIDARDRRDGTRRRRRPARSPSYNAAKEAAAIDARAAAWRRLGDHYAAAGDHEAAAAIREHLAEQFSEHGPAAGGDAASAKPDARPAPTRPEPAAVPTAGAGTQEQKGRDDRGR